VSSSARQDPTIRATPVKAGDSPDPSRGRLVVNEREAAKVQEIFGQFLRDGSRPCNTQRCRGHHHLLAP
jgi:hypothetical protein